MFTCLTPGHYTISYTASAGNWGDGLVRVHQIYLYLNGEQVVVVVVVVLNNNQIYLYLNGEQVACHVSLDLDSDSVV